MIVTRTVQTVVTPVINAVAYTANDALGGLLTFPNALLGLKKTGVIVSAVLVDKADQGMAADLVLFDQEFTPTANNAEFDPSADDMSNCIGVVPFLAGDYASFANNAVATARDVDLGVTNVGDSEKALYGQLVTRGAPTYAIGDIIVKLMVMQN